ncbi:PAS domain-containing protein [Streptomyces sp. NPDC002523]
MLFRPTRSFTPGFGRCRSPSQRPVLRCRKAASERPVVGRDQGHRPTERRRPAARSATTDVIRTGSHRPGRSGRTAVSRRRCRVGRAAGYSKKDPSGHRRLCDPPTRGPGSRCGLCGKDGGDVVEDLRSGGEHERRLSAAEPGLWQRVVEQLGTAVAVVDPAGRIVAVNPAAERLMGRTAVAMYGRTCMTCATGTRKAPSSRESAVRCCGRWPQGARHAGTTTGASKPGRDSSSEPTWAPAAIGRAPPCPAAGVHAPALHRRPDRSSRKRPGQRARPAGPSCPRPRP